MQDVLTWRWHAGVFAQPRDLRLPNDDDDEIYNRLLNLIWLLPNSAMYSW